MTIIILLILLFTEIATAYFRVGRSKASLIFVTPTSASIHSQRSDVGASLIGTDVENANNAECEMQPSIAKDEQKDTKVTRRRRPTFEKVLKCLILYNELKTGNRAKAISQIHNTPDNLVVDKLVKPSLRKFNGEVEEEDDNVGISLFLLMMPNKNFVIPSDDDRWPRDCAGINLGQLVADIRRKRSFKRDSQKEILDLLHFPWKPTSARFAHVLEGLAIYRAQYGDRPLKNNFMIPVVSGTRGVQTSDDDGEIDVNTTFDPLAEQHDMWKARQQSTSQAIKGFQANKDYIFARAKAVEDSPWPVHLMGFHLGKALRLLQEDIRQRYAEYSETLQGTEVKDSISKSNNDYNGNRNSQKEGINLNKNTIPTVSFAATEGGSATIILEEIQEQVRLLGLYGVTIDLGSTNKKSVKAGLGTVADQAIPEKEGSRAKSRVVVSAGDTDTEGGDSSAVDDAQSRFSSTFHSTSAHSTSAESSIDEDASDKQVRKRRQGRPRRGRNEDEIFSGEPVTLAGAVKLARKRELELRARLKSSSVNANVDLLPNKLLPSRGESEMTEQVKSVSTSTNTGGGDDQAANESNTEFAYSEERLARGMAAVRTLEALGEAYSAESDNVSPSPISAGHLPTEASSEKDTFSENSSNAHEENVEKLQTGAVVGTKRKKKIRRRRVDSVLRFNNLLEGLQIYHSIYGNHRVPVRFTVPGAPQASPDAGLDVESGEPDEDGEPRCKSLWPEHLYGFSLGKELSRVLSSLNELNEWLELSEYDVDDKDEDLKAHMQELIERRQALASLGVPLMKRRDQNFELILSALKIHDELFGDLLVPRYFVVPREEPWPTETWGMPLGHKVRNIRYRGAYCSPANRKRLREIGFSFDYVKEVTALQSEEKKRDLGQHWYEGAYELWEEQSEGDIENL